MQYQGRFGSRTTLVREQSLRRGSHKVKVVLRRRNPHIIPDMTLTDVELGGEVRGGVNVRSLAS